MLVSLDFLKNVLSGFKKDIDKSISDAQDSKKIEPSDNDLPIVNLTGSIPVDKTELFCELDYSSLTDSFHAYVKIKVQGGISTKFRKKNFAIELFSDKGTLIPLVKEFKSWGKQNEYVLKANYIDHLHSRNIVCANLWADIVRSREDFNSLPEELRNSPNMGAVDGFPIKLYANGEYQGIYTWNIPKKDWLFNMEKNNPKHAAVQGNVNDLGNESLMNNTCNFGTLWNGKDGWSFEAGIENDNVVNSFNKIIQAVLDIFNANPERLPECKSKLEEVLDIRSFIDYCVFQNTIFGIDSFGNNIMFITYDMKKWYVTAYDMDSTFNLNYDGIMLKGQGFLPYDSLIQFSRLIHLAYTIYSQEIIDTYKRLSRTSLSYANVISKFEKFLAVVNDDIRIEDIIPYPEIPSAIENTFDYLRNYYNDRLKCLDVFFNKMEV